MVVRIAFMPGSISAFDSHDCELCWWCICIILLNMHVQENDLEREISHHRQHKDYTRAESWKWVIAGLSEAVHVVVHVWDAM